MGRSRGRVLPAPSAQSAPSARRALGAGAALGVGAALAGLVYDPRAAAADGKRAAALFVAVTALSLVLVRVLRGARKDPRARGGVAIAAALWLGFVAWSAAALAWGVPAGSGALGGWVGASGVLVAAMRMPEAEARRAASVAGAIVGGGSAIAALAQYATGARGMALHGGHGNPNWLGLALAVALPLSADLTVALRRERSTLWIAAAVATGLELPALFLSHSRVAWAATFASLLLWAATAGRPWRGARMIAAGSLAAALLVGAAAASAAPGSAGSPGAGEEESAPTAFDVPLATAWEGRVWIWKASAEAAGRAMPFGVGLGGFGHAYLDAQGAMLAQLDPRLASRRFTNATTAHCDWLEAAVESGFVGLALLAGSIAAGILGLLRGGWPAGAAALAALAVSATGDSPMQQPGALLPAVLVLGACPRSRRGVHRAWVAVVAAGIAGAALLLATSVATWLSVRRLTRADDALPEDRLPLLASAVRLDPGNGKAALALGLARLSLGDAAGALRDLEQSRSLLANVGTEIAIGNAHMLLKAPERAALAYRRALARNPGSFRGHANLTEALTALGKLDEAEAHLAVAQSLWPGHPKLGPMAERLRRARIDAETSE